MTEQDHIYRILSLVDQLNSALRASEADGLKNNISLTPIATMRSSGYVISIEVSRVLGRR